MSVKILLDTVMTASPSRCSTFIQFVTFMKYILDVQKRTDVFFYCLIPTRDYSQAELDWMPKHPNIEYIPRKQHPDRTKEYLTLNDQMDELLAFNGTHWDADIVITVRSGMAALYKLLMTSPRQTNLKFVREVWVIEDMPLMSFKSSVLKIDPDVQDRFTIDGYLAADRVVVMSYHEKALALQAAKNWYVPSVIRGLQDKMKEVIPVQILETFVKDSKFWFTPGSGRFTVAYVGRLMASTANLDLIYKVMTNQWIMKGNDKIRLVVATNSVGGKKTVQPTEIMEKYYAPREEFWRMSKEEMHVLLIMHDEAGFLLSMMEPIMLGTPAIVIRAPWSVGQLGESYPFYANNETEAYTLLRMFYDNYAYMYAKFSKWRAEWLIPTYKHRCKEDLLYSVLAGYLDAYSETVLPLYRKRSPTKGENDIIQLLLVDAPEDFVLMDRLKELSEAGKIRSLDQKMKEHDRDQRGLAWSASWNDFRVALKAYHNFEDASTKVGHLKRIKA